ncbi:Pvc16 family protein [Streptomyces luteireticuli]|uniref:Pvc16 family protein n=1 Tax=Streptomyces luteireticuli TaxID=173858 RepID=UPI0035562E64
MIDVVDRALCKRVQEDLRYPETYTIEFRPPSGGTAPGGTIGTETVGIYLHDIREDLDRRMTGLVHRYGPLPGSDRPAKLAHHDPPRYTRLSYLLTAWAPDPMTSHRMLGELLTGLSTDREFELELPEELEEMGLVARLEIGSPPVDDRAVQELWSAVGHRLVPALHVTVIVPLLSFAPERYKDHVRLPLVLGVELPRADPPPVWDNWPPQPDGEPLP